MARRARGASREVVPGRSAGEITPWDRSFALLRRLVPLARRIDRGIRILALSGGVAAVLVTGGIAALARPSTGRDGLALAIVAAVLLVPAVVLWLFHRALAEVVELPEKLRTYPDLVRGHGAELAELVQAARGRRPAGRDGRRGFGGDVIRSVKMLTEVYGNLPDKAAMLPLISPPLLMAVGVSFGAVILEWVVAGILVVVVPLTLALR